MSKTKVKKQSKLYEWQQRALQQGDCGRCGKHLGQLTVDHIIPMYFIDSIDVTGILKYEWEENFQLICYPCNQLKSGRLDLANPKTVPLLKELVNKL